jgi:NADH:ubiquinone oxidoreductase subunit E
MDEQVKEIFGRYEPDQRYALAILQDMQRAFNYVPEEGIAALAEYLGTSEAQLYGMATFYKALSLKPKGKHIIKICDGTACHLRRSSNLMEGVKRALDIEPGDVTDDGLFSLELVNCMGSCALAPVMVVDDDIYGSVRAEQVPSILSSYSDTAGGE